MSMASRLIILSILALFTGVQSARASVITLDAVNSGRYTSSGDHDPANASIDIQVNLGTTSGDEWRNFFVFDLSSVQGTIQSAVLRLETSVVFREVEYLDP